MHKKYHEKFKILDILAVTIQAREGIETIPRLASLILCRVTIQAREGIETPVGTRLPHLLQRVTIQVREGIETSWRIC